VAWLRPGQPVPPRQQAMVGSGFAGGRSWSATAYAGPWGMCLVFESAATAPGPLCQPLAGLRPGAGAVDRLGVYPHTPRWFVAAERPAVTQVRLRMSSGTTVRVPVVDVAGRRLWAFAVTAHPRIVRWAAYDAAGHRLYGGPGPPDRG
jgi:hypothetical protein